MLLLRRTGMRSENEPACSASHARGHCSFASGTVLPSSSPRCRSRSPAKHTASSPSGPAMASAVCLACVDQDQGAQHTDRTLPGLNIEHHTRLPSVWLHHPVRFVSLHSERA